jgi:hypothetical protein
MTPRQRLVKMFMKVNGMPPEDALKAAQDAVEAIKEL